MRVDYSSKFLREFDAAPDSIKKSFTKKKQLLLYDLRHPSLHAKKYDEAKDIWQARVTKGWRFYFKIVGDTYYLITIMSHSK